MEKHLYRSTERKVIAGVLGGFGEYLEIDPVLLRVIWLAITVFSGLAPGIIVYILAVIVIPKRPDALHMGPAKSPEPHSDNHPMKVPESIAD